jgi:CYTH domain-containing protein
MEIEKKFLLKEKEKIFANRNFFPQMDAVKKEVKTKGRQILQHYLPLELLDELKQKLDIKLKFQPNEIRIRKMGWKHTLTFKSKGKIKRSEYEKSISKEMYKEYKEKAEKSLEKYRLKKPVKGKLIELDYYPKQSLITCEVEVKNMSDLKKIPKYGKDISEEKKYSNRQLAD